MLHCVLWFGAPFYFTPLVSCLIIRFCVLCIKFATFIFTSIHGPIPIAIIGTTNFVVNSLFGRRFKTRIGLDYKWPRSSTLGLLRSNPLRKDYSFFCLVSHCKQAEIITLINGYLATYNLSMIYSKMKLLDVLHFHFHCQFSFVVFLTLICLKFYYINVGGQSVSIMLLWQPSNCRLIAWFICLSLCSYLVNKYTMMV